MTQIELISSSRLPVRLYVPCYSDSIDIPFDFSADMWVSNLVCFTNASEFSYSSIEGNLFDLAKWNSTKPIIQALQRNNTNKVDIVIPIPFIENEIMTVELLDCDFKVNKYKVFEFKYFGNGNINIIRNCIKELELYLLKNEPLKILQKIEYSRKKKKQESLLNSRSAKVKFCSKRAKYILLAAGKKCLLTPT